MMIRPTSIHLIKWFALVSGSAFLASCQQPGEKAEPAPSPSESAPAIEPSPTESQRPASILRNDIADAPISPPPLEPLELTVPFPEGGTELNEAAKEVVAEALASPQYAKAKRIVLRGHTDSEGYDEANLRASRNRAEAVAALFLDAGADEDLIKIIPLGEQRPIAPNAHLDGTVDEEGRARNRRVDIRIEPKSEPKAKPSPAPEPSRTKAPSLAEDLSS